MPIRSATMQKRVDEKTLKVVITDSSMNDDDDDVNYYF